MLNFTMEQIILAAAVFLIAYVALRLLAGLLRIVAFVAVLAGLWVLAFQPSLLNTADINSQVAQLSPKAEVALAEFNRCFSQVVASIGHGGESECKQRAITMLQQSGGTEYVSEVSQAIEQLLKDSRQTAM